MRPALSSAIVVGLLFIAALAPAQTLTGLSAQLSYTVPGISGTIKQIEFADVNGDGLKEVLATNGHAVTLYDIGHDSVLFSLPDDSVHYISAIALADINRDAVPDVVIATTNWRDSLNAAVQVYSGTSGWTLRDSVGYSNYFSPYAQGLPGIRIDAVDIDDDGYDELWVGYDSVGIRDLIGENNVGVAHMYSLFPSTLETTLDDRIFSFHRLPHIDGLPEFLVDYYDYNYNELGCHGLSKYTSLVGFESSGLTDPQIIGPGGMSCFGDDNIHVHTTSFQAAIPTDSSLIVITRKTYYDYCYQDYGDTSVTASGSVLNAHELLPGQGAQLRWSLEGGQYAYYAFLHKDSHPGQTYCFHLDTLLLLNADDGSVAKRFGTVPGSIRFWARPYANDNDYLVTRDSNVVSYYAFDAVTDVEDNTAPNLPTTFSLGTPYPNPFNPTVTIPVTMSRRGELVLEAYNTLGQRVDRINAGSLPAGETNVQWNASDHPSGVYLLRATINGNTQTVKALLLK